MHNYNCMNKEEILNNYKIGLDKIISIDEVEWNFLKFNFELKTFKRKDILIEFNNVTNHIFLIVEGYVQLFHKAKNKEFTIDFFSPPVVVTSFESFINRTPSKLCLKAITDVTVLVGNYDIIAKAYMKFPPVQRLSRYFTEYALLSRLKSEYDNNSLSAKDKYFYLLKRHPELISNLTQKQIASYIGIAPESLCRIKRTIEVDNNMITNYIK